MEQFAVRLACGHEVAVEVAPAVESVGVTCWCGERRVQGVTPPRKPRVIVPAEVAQCGPLAVAKG